MSESKLTKEIYRAGVNGSAKMERSMKVYWLYFLYNETGASEFDRRFWINVSKTEM